MIMKVEVLIAFSVLVVAGSTLLLMMCINARLSTLASKSTLFNPFTAATIAW